MREHFTLWGEDEMRPEWRVFWTILHFILSYELLAMHIKHWPTLTRLSWRYRHLWRGKAGILVFLGILFYHLYLQEEVLKKVLEKGIIIPPNSL